MACPCMLSGLISTRSMVRIIVNLKFIRGGLIDGGCVVAKGRCDEFREALIAGESWLASKETSSITSG
jgi:hypothetical protein